jgi:hypothetical protein
MDRLASVLTRLTAYAAASSFDGRLKNPLDASVELSGLERRLMAMRDRFSYGSAVEVPRLDLEALVYRWQRSQFDVTQFTMRELRALCWDSRMVEDERFVRAIESIPKLAGSARVLRGLWYSHERQWRLRTAPIIEQLIVARELTGGLAPGWLRTLWKNKNVLSAAAPSALALRAQADWRAARSGLAQAAVTVDGALGSAAIEAMMSQWIADVLAQRTSGDAVAMFNAGHDGLLAEQRLPVGLLRMAVELLVGAVQGQKHEYRSRIAEWIIADSRLGHPARRRTRGNWAGISERVRQLAVQLFAARDLGAFFQVLIGSGDDYQERRRFWERYVDSQQLVNFSIASDLYDRQKLVASLGKDRVEVARLLNAPDNHSAFMMHFRGKVDIVVVEISKANNAMYLYLASTFEEHVGELQDDRFTFKQLKNQDLYQERRSHSLNWHRNFEYVLGHYGVSPGARGWQ